MSNLLYARSLMALSLAYHIIFATVGIGMPLLMVIAEGLYLRKKDPLYLDLSKRWSKGVAILFAVGAVSGTVLSFELGLLWPSFMAFAGSIIGAPFALEGFAFFTEAIFLGIYLYGWNRLAPLVHWLSGVAIAISGAVSGMLVMTANAWMNAPAGFELVGEKVVGVSPLAVMLNPATPHEVVHMILATYVATGFVVAAIHAFFVLRGQNVAFHRRALGIALAMACISIPLQIISGDWSAKTVARLQPAKLAAMEGHYETQAAAPLIVGGIPDDEAMTTRYALRIPYGLSFLAFADPQATVAGLDQFPRDEWPNTLLVHWAFDIMVAAGGAMLLLAIWTGWLWLRNKRRLPDHRPWLWALVIGGPLGFIAIETGWIVTEVGRQPWIIYEMMRTAEAVTTMTGLFVPFIAFIALYTVLGIVLIVLLRRQFLESAEPAAPHVIAEGAHGSST